MRLKLVIVAIVATLLVANALAGEVEDVVVAGQIAFRITDPGSFGSVSARGTDVDQRVCEAISSEDVGNPKMSVAKRGGLFAVYIGKTYLVSVYPGDAKMYGTPAQKLAATWASKLKALFPLAQPMGKAGVNSRTTAMDLKAAQAALLRQVKVPPQHWGIVERYMLDLWDARQVKEGERGLEELRMTARVVEDGAKHYYVTDEGKPGHEPGTCDHVKTCEVCQAMIAACIDTPAAKHDDATVLAKLLADDEESRRAVKQALEYCWYVDQARFMRERTRIAWQLWQRMDARAKGLHEKAEAVVAAAAQTLPAQMANPGQQ